MAGPLRWPGALLLLGRASNPSDPEVCHRANFHVQAMEWSADGRALVLADRDTHCFCFEGLPSESAATAAEAPPRAA
ncbi:hypothetical protein PAPYR_6852 [Paratrimastix pyriformis]|uniref:Uncharacterized protein n=1 Tax=Paratrimastix pyriformis TaxID=342808 RepID=A0ABQ8UJI9_9EUKA|nr:hypothetical protein PAPYR_6852 [Paratrimastix pyriformis]